jgi:hypothetical protein
MNLDALVECGRQPSPCWSGTSLEDDLVQESVGELGIALLQLANHIPEVRSQVTYIPVRRKAHVTKNGQGTFTSDELFSSSTKLDWRVQLHQPPPRSHFAQQPAAGGFKAKELGIKAHMDAIDHLRASNWTILPFVML